MDEWPSTPGVQDLRNIVADLHHGLRQRGLAGDADAIAYALCRAKDAGVPEEERERMATHLFQRLFDDPSPRKFWSRGLRRSGSTDSRARVELESSADQRQLGGGFSDRQARATILAAESLGFEREPDLYPAHYNHSLNEDAQYAAEYLRERDPARLEAALASDEPILAQCAAWRITETGRFTVADADIVLRAATARGFQPPPSDLPLLAHAIRWDQARAAVAYFWEQDPEQLEALIGETARLAPLPDTARSTEHGCRGHVDSCRCGR